MYGSLTEHRHLTALSRAAPQLSTRRPLLETPVKIETAALHSVKRAAFSCEEAVAIRAPSEAKLLRMDSEIETPRAFRDASLSPFHTKSPGKEGTMRLS